MNLPALLGCAIAAVFGAPERERLWGDLESFRVQFECAPAAARKTESGPSSEGGPDSTSLSQAKAYWSAAMNEYKLRNTQQAWTLLKCARRALLCDQTRRHSLVCEAIALSREVEKISGWRGKAIADFLGDPACKAVLDKACPAPMSLSDEAVFKLVKAIELRDDYENTRYFKISMRRRSLIMLALGLTLSIAACLVLFWSGKILPPFTTRTQLVTMVLFGGIGAVLSVTQSFMTADLSMKIPELQVGSFAVWVRPVVGASAAVIAYTMVSLGLLPDVVKAHGDVALIVLAVVAGYSERFILGAIDKVAGGGEDKKNKEA